LFFAQIADEAGDETKSRCGTGSRTAPGNYTSSPLSVYDTAAQHGSKGLVGGFVHRAAKDAVADFAGASRQNRTRAVRAVVVVEGHRDGLRRTVGGQGCCAGGGDSDIDRDGDRSK